MKEFLKTYSLPAALILALAGLLGSLYFSEIAGLAPCNLCWYQRIALYPLVPILAVGIARRDPNAWRYGLPLALIGFVIGTYHLLLTWHVLPTISSCGIGASCATITWSIAGFITIPFLSWLSFLVISALLLIYRKISNS